MAGATQAETAGTPPQSLVNVAHLVYALHAWSILAGIVGAATVVGMFLTGWPSIIAVIINYVKRPDARGTWLDSHFGWQIRTFWYTLLWVVIAVALALAVIPLALAMLVAAGIHFWAGVAVWHGLTVGLTAALAIAVVITLWVVYRIVRGWLALASRQSMPV